jgi:hypothetical protein
MHFLRIAVALFIALGLGVAGTTPPLASAQTAGTATLTPAPFIPYKNDNGSPRKVVYVLAMSGDALTRAKFVSTLTRQLQSDYDLAKTKLLPEPDWGVADYISACQTSPAYTSGALIIGIGAISTGAHSYFIGRSNWTQIHASLFYSLCAGPTPAPTPIPPTPTPNPSPPTGGSTVVSTPNSKDATKDLTVVTTNWTVAPSPAPSPYYSLRWQTDVQSERGKVGFLTPLPALGFLLTLVAGYTAVAPSRTSTGMVTTVFATPPPFIPFPAKGAVTQSVDTRTSTTNVSQFGGIATALLTQSLSYSGNVQSVVTTDEQTLKAIDNVVKDFLYQLNCKKKNLVPGETPAPNPSSDTCAFVYYDK